MFCSGTKATVTYKFGSSSPKTYVTDNTPIQISTETKRVNASENYNANGFQITFYSPNNFNTQGYIVRDYLLEDVGRGPKYMRFRPWRCDKFDFEPNGPAADSTTIIIDPTKTCPTPLVDRCNIQIKNSSGEIIFTDQGECPITYSVQCGDCPPNTIKIPQDGYPGFKCREICPETTCCECETATTICCYDCSGNVIKTITK